MRTLINPREIWKREDEDFSPWLARNLNLLNDILHTELTLVSLEQSVGRFSADIFCVNAIDGSLAVIENQLEITDHSHLGKILTYAVGLQSRYIIWISTEFENEHRNVLEWLNDNTGPGFQFFGVKLELISINNSECRPRFSLISEPRNRIHLPVNRPSSRNLPSQQGSSSRNLPSQQGSSSRNDHVDSRSQFWSKFREYIDNSSTSLEPVDWDPNKPDYLGFNIGQTHFWLAAWRHPRGIQIAVNLHMRQQYIETHFDQLEECKDEINQDFNTDIRLEWQREPYHLRNLVRQNPDHNIPQVGVYNRSVNLTYEEDWTDYFTWMVNNLENLYRVFHPRIEQLFRQ